MTNTALNLNITKSSKVVESFYPQNQTNLLLSENTEDELYIYTWIAKRSTWMIGQGNKNPANAVKGGNTNCPKDIIIPETLLHENNEYPIDEIGTWSFANCGLGNTRSVFISKQVKFIRESAFLNMNSVTSFTIEAGSVLKTLEANAITGVGIGTADRTYTKTIDLKKTLILPSTLSNVKENSIFKCDLFTRVIYCGISNLNADCFMESQEPDTFVYTLPEYKDKNGNRAFGYALNPKSDVTYRKIYEICDLIADVKSPDVGCRSTFPGRSLSPILFLVLALY